MTYTFILSYKGNEKMAERLEKQLTEQDFPNIKIIYAPDCSTNKMKPNKVVYHTFKNYLLTEAEKAGEDFVYFEDDADITSHYSVYQRYFKGKIARLSYWKLQKHFIVGSTCIWFSQDFIPVLAEQMKKKMEQHIDGFFTKLGNTLADGEHYVIPKQEMLGGTITHESYIMDGEMRTGYRVGDQGGFKLVDDTKKYMRAGFLPKKKMIKIKK